jgi:hypothetical protein
MVEALEWPALGGTIGAGQRAAIRRLGARFGSRGPADPEMLLRRSPSPSPLSHVANVAERRSITPELAKSAPPLLAANPFNYCTPNVFSAADPANVR